MNQGSNSASSQLNTTLAPGEQSKLQKEIFYSPASDNLISVRRSLAIFSFDRAQKRLQLAAAISDDDELETQDRQRVRNLYSISKEITLNSSQFAEERPLSSIRYSPEGSLAATGSLSCNVNIWNTKDLNHVDTLRGHQERITSVTWHPDAFTSISGKSLLASSAADATCKIWNCKVNSNSMDIQNDSSINKSDSSLIHTLKGHQGVVNDCKFHPNGQLIGTASSDYTWRLWDIETATELQLQDGHIKDCTSLTFHTDGSLVLTSDAAGVALLWDLRSGQEIHAFQGHIQKITSSSFNVNGFQVATGSLDNMVRIWDIRQRKCFYCLPAHSNLISDLTYSKSGEILLTSSFDATIKIWGTRDYELLKSLSGHLGKVMSCDISPVDECHVISAGFDRTVKIWAHKDEF